MHMIQAMNKNELMSKIGELDHTVEKLYINARPSMEIVNRIMDNAPNVQELYCPPSLLKQTSTKVFGVLEKRGVKLAHKPIRVGRPNKYENETVNQITEKRAAGIAVKDISDNMGIPLRTVYYYLKNTK